MTRDLLMHLIGLSPTKRVMFSGEVYGTGTIKDALWAMKVKRNPFRTLKRPEQKLNVTGSGILLSVSAKPDICEGFALIQLEHKFRKDIECVGVAIECVMVPPTTGGKSDEVLH